MGKELPYKSFGVKLRALREQAKESLVDVSGAVEIDSKRLELIENGIERPSEDIVLLLINHFELEEKEADSFWELAGYNPDLIDEFGYIEEPASPHIPKNIQPAIMVLPMDARIVYSDMVNVSVNQYGVIINFMQGTGPNMQPIAISRIGMSKEHAKSVIDVLTSTLQMQEKSAKPKELGSADSAK